MIKSYTLIFLLISTITLKAFQADTLSSASQSIDEVLLLKDQQQKQIDSLVRIQLEKQLKAAAGDQRKTRELEEKLRKIALSDSLRQIQQAAEISKLKINAKGYPVVLNQDTLFYVFTRTGSFSAQERAQGISKKIGQVYNDAFFLTDSLQLRATGDNFDLVYKNSEIILTVSNLDGPWFAKSNAQLAEEYLQVIRKEISRERDAHSLFNWVKRIGLAVLILVLLFVMVMAIKWLFSRLLALVNNRIRKRTNGLKLGSIRMIPAKDLELLATKVSGGLRLLVTLLTIYLSLPLLFSVFPETESWTSTLLSWILGPLRIALKGIAGYLPNLFTIVVIYLIFRYGLKAVRYFFDEVKRGNVQLRGFHADWALPTFNILRFVLYAFMLIIIFPYLPGSGSAAFQGVSVFLGILISIGSSSAIGNIVAGLVITYMRPFRIGDRVKIGEVTGDIIEKTMLVTRVRTIKNEDITVPNAMVLSSSTVNYSAQAASLGLILHYEVTIGYDVPWKKVYELLIDAAKKTPNILADPEPFVLQTNLNDYYVSYQINAYTNQAGMQALIYSQLLENIQDGLGSAGIELLSPQYNVIRKEPDR
ncbi:mechanosensitive ion channel domain-containing protein [Pedobacter aquatilis]|uniref:mechanosensitive ion channel domain-containing protein n=1 Tax=Pedobacter aquatilis TaxID=351343 RepID=UPI002930CAEC|nr:mechanosensitive ion channel domain-containing protein [Pedobacter aquatilis]